MSDYLSRREAVKLLGVKPQTLYSYASRGLVESVRVESGSKEHYYLRADIEKLRLRASARAGHGPAAAAALRYGDPVISSAITELSATGHRYRGYRVSEIASRCSFEQIAGLLWTGKLDAGAQTWGGAQSPSLAVQHFARQIQAGNDEQSILTLFAVHVLDCSVGRPLQSPLAAARAIVQRLAGCFGYYGSAGRFYRMRARESIAEAVLHASSLPVDDASCRSLDGLLGVLADYELASATFAARVVASCGADLTACVAAGIESSAASLREHRRVARLLDGVRTIGTLRKRIDAFRREGEAPPGFQPGLYHADDPRTAILLSFARAGRHKRKLTEIISEFVANDAPRRGLHTRSVLGTVTFDMAFGFPTGSRPALFLLARTAGWIAHAIEQSGAGPRLRPRAVFREDAHANTDI